jgi:Sulfotransferase family
MALGPIFVAGLERSGTSLMYALLASHPRIAMTRRTNLWTHFYGQYGDLGDDANLDRCLDTMLRYRRLVKLRPDRERLRHELRTGEPTYGRLFALLCQQHAERLGKPRWGDKSLNTERYARPILDAYPDARIVHMIRDPRDRFASSVTRWQRRRGGIGAGTAEWLASARLAVRNARDHGGSYRLIRYESLVAAADDVMRGVCEFIGEPFAPEMMAMQGAPVGPSPPVPWAASARCCHGSRSPSFSDSPRTRWLSSATSPTLFRSVRTAGCGSPSRPCHWRPPGCWPGGSGRRSGTGEAAPFLSIV